MRFKEQRIVLFVLKLCGLFSTHLVDGELQNLNSDEIPTKRTCYATLDVFIEPSDWTKPDYSQTLEKNCSENLPHCLTMTLKSGKVVYECGHCPKMGANFYEKIGTVNCCDTDRCNKPKPFHCHFRETENGPWDKCEADGVETFCAGYYDDFSVGKCTNECKNQKLNVRIEGGRDKQGRDRSMMCCDTAMCNMPKPKSTQSPEDGGDESGGASSMKPWPLTVLMMGFVWLGF